VTDYKGFYELFTVILNLECLRHQCLPYANAMSLVFV